MLTTIKKKNTKGNSHSRAVLEKRIKGLFKKRLFLKSRQNLWKHLRKHSFFSQDAGYKPATLLKTNSPVGILQRSHPQSFS